MDIWIIQNGEKTGPFPDYTVRSKIARDELRADTPAWHEGLPKWTPLAEISIFEREFSDGISHDPEVAENPSVSPLIASDESLGTSPRCRAIRRFWARWLDLYLYAGLWWFAMWAMGNDVKALLSNLPLMLLIYLPWFGLEVLMIHHFATTPGKWLLGIKVCNHDGTLLTLSQSLRRSLRVFFLGIGMGWEFMALVCQAISFYHTKRNGTPIWDTVGQHQVLCSSLRPLRITTYVLLLFFSLQLQSAVLVPYIREVLIQRFPELRQSLNDSPAWELPNRQAPLLPP